MQPLRRASLLLVAGLAVVVCAPKSGNARGPADPAAQTQPTKLRLVATFLNSIPGSAALEVAYKRGYYKDAGLDLQFASAIGGGDTLRPLTTGDADVSIGSPAASVLAVMRNPDLKIAAIWLPYNPFYFIGTKPLTQLNGAKLGGSVGASTVNLLIEGLGDKLNVKLKIQRAGTGSMADNWDAVKAGLLQASWAMQPFVTQKEETDGAKVVIDPAKYIPDYPADFVVINEKFAKSHAQAVKEFFQAVERIFNEFPDPSKRAALSKDLAGVMVFPEPVIQKYLSTEDPSRLSKTYSLKMNTALLSNISHLMQQSQLVTAPVDWQKYVDQSYLPAADQSPDLP
jgi:NitT/TauT family transport system substrate-binding protein